MAETTSSITEASLLWLLCLNGWVVSDLLIFLILSQAESTGLLADKHKKFPFV